MRFSDTYIPSLSLPPCPSSLPPSLLHVASSQVTTVHRKVPTRAELHARQGACAREAPTAFFLARQSRAPLAVKAAPSPNSAPLEHSAPGRLRQGYHVWRTEATTVQRALHICREIPVRLGFSARAVSKIKSPASQRRASSALQVVTRLRGSFATSASSAWAEQLRRRSAQILRQDITVDR
jgi:hypothetical protein